ncbi:AraC family transcriptional regulator [Halomonas sp. I5-271120]|uniref:helix-turn-helix transcriptional regulator n=1 Tax=Halomonas sp. I5-271120 TaxID=3061632 RepID=UPI002714D30F|nr:AraC family transcriptional regulator [Halomonas sp. I5-271120]
MTVTDPPVSPLIAVRSYPDRVLSDRHGYHQLLLGLEGGVELEVAGRGRRVEPGVLVPIPAGETHYYLAPRDNHTLVVDLPQAWCETLALGIGLAPDARRLPPALMASARQLEEGDSTALAAWLSSAMRVPAHTAGEPRLRLLRLLPEIEADLARRWRVRDWAARCHLAEAAFARQFHALTGRSPHAWLVERRLAKAKTLMAETSASITEIALACGFGDTAHFSRTFRERHGLSPRGWRQAQPIATSASKPSR